MLPHPGPGLASGVGHASPRSRSFDVPISGVSIGEGTCSLVTDMFQLGERAGRIMCVEMVLWAEGSRDIGLQETLCSPLCCSWPEGFPGGSPHPAGSHSTLALPTSPLQPALGTWCCGHSLIFPALDKPELEHLELGLSCSRRNSGWIPGSTSRQLGVVGGRVVCRAVFKAQSQQ